MDNGTLNNSYFDKNLVQIIRDALENKSIYKVGNFKDYEIGNIMVNKFENIYLLYKDKNIVGATSIVIGKCGNLQVKISKKFFNEYKNILIDLYSFISLNRNTYIYSDDNLQTDPSSYIWKKIIDTKQNIKVLYECNETQERDKKIIWGPSVEHKKYVIGFRE